MPNKVDLGVWTKDLPHVIGIVNSITTLFLVFGLIFVKTGKISAHRVCMASAFFLGVVFLICYVIYHLTNPANKFGGDGIFKIVYLLILASHILLSLLVLPLVLRSMYFAVTSQFDRHRRTARYAYPIWLYVSVSGVAVYLMLNHVFAGGS
jgi:putative membrane protein